MILQKNIPLVVFAKVFDVFVFASGNKLTECFRSSFVFQYFAAIEPVFHMIAFADNLCLVPFAYGIRLFIFGFYQVI